MIRTFVAALIDLLCLMAENTALKFQSMASGLVSIGLPIRQIARESELSTATVFRAIHGESRMPSFESYTRLERAWIAHGKPVKLG